MEFNIIINIPHHYRLRLGTELELNQTVLIYCTKFAQK